MHSYHDNAILTKFLSVDRIFRFSLSNRHSRNAPGIIETIVCLAFSNSINTWITRITCPNKFYKYPVNNKV